MKLLAAIFALSLTAQAAYANDVKLTLRSIPEGASVFTVQTNGIERLWGTGPVILKWQVPRRWNSCITTESIKVLPADVAGDRERLARFQLDARQDCIGLKLTNTAQLEAGFI